MKLEWEKEKELSNSGLLGTLHLYPSHSLFYLFAHSSALYSHSARVGRVIFEIGGPNLRPEIAHAGSSLSRFRLPLPLTPLTSIYLQ